MAIPVQGVATDLFAGKSFWLSVRVPQRARFSAEIETNGGIVVKSEKDADVKIVDHMAKEVLPETYSYRFIELSLRKGRLEHLDDHAIGPRAPSARPVSSIERPRKQSRTAFSVEDDLFLWKSVERFTAQGMMALGNEMYKILEEQNNRHPWQSWRDRWVKTLQYRPRPAQLQRPRDTDEGPARESTVPASDSVPCSRRDNSANETNREATNQHNIKREGAKHRTGKQRPTNSELEITSTTDRDSPLEEDPYYEEDVKNLLKTARDILNIDPKRVKEAWEAWEESFPHRTELEWRKFFKDQVLPIYHADQIKQNPFTSSSRESASKPQEETPSSAQMGSLLSKTSHVASKDPPYPQIGSQLSTPPHSDHSVLPSPSEETDSPGSLSFHPENPTIRSCSVSRAQKKVVLPYLNTTSNTLEDAPVIAERSHIQTFTTVPPRSPKRKPAIDEDDNEIHRSTPMKRPRPYKKPRRHEGDDNEIREIPSTPDKPSDPPPKRTPSKVTPKTRRRYPHNSIFVDQEDIWDDKADILSPPIGAAVPSVSLSEPPPTPPSRLHGGLTYRPSPTKETQEPVIDMSTTQKESAFETAPTQLFETAPSHLPQSLVQAQSETQTQLESLDSEMIILDTPSPSHEKKQGSRESLPLQELDTQAILTTYTQIPDFTLAEPDGGWYAYESPSASQKAVEPDPPTVDDSIPSPPGGWQDAPAPTAPTQKPPPSNQSQVLSKPSISDWVAAWTSDKITRQQVSAVLQSTSMDANLANVVLRYMQLGQNVPPLRDVWTEEDDADVQGQNGRGIKRLLKKHGNKGVEERWKFLERWRIS